jgi:phage-related protein (TIGR01555 family)
MLDWQKTFGYFPLTNVAPEISPSDLDSIRLDQVISSLKAAGAFAQMDASRLEQFVQGSQATKFLTAANLYELYQENNFIANLVDTLPDNACQKYAIATIDDWEGEGENPVQSEINKAKPFVNWCWKAARLQGWAAVIVYINDGQKDLSQPVNERSIKGIADYSVRVGGDQGEITVVEWDSNQISPTYGDPILFSVGGTRVHRSRLMLFHGVKRLSHSQYNSNSSQLGTSVVKRCYQEFRNFQLSNNAIASTMASFNQKILKIKDLATVMASQKSFEQYISGMSLAMNVLGMLLVDAESGDFSIAGHQYGGVPDLLAYYKGIFAGSTDLSHTELFGESPSGQTSGSYQEKQKAQYTHGRQESELLPELNRIARYVCLSQGIAPEDCTIEFPTLYELDAKDQADVNLKNAQSMRTLVGAQGGQIVTEDEAAKALARDTTIGDQIDIDAREEMIGALRQEPEGFVQTEEQS